MQSAQSRLRLIRLSEVTHRCGLRRTQIFNLQRSGRFPRRVKIGKRAVAWVSSEIDAWIAERIKDPR